MRTAALMLSLAPAVVLAQSMPAPVAESEVFKREDIGHALAAPTPEAGRTAPASANAPPDDGQWTMPSKNYASTRFSGLDEITVANVKNLTPDFSFSLAVNKGQEAAPIVADNTMYIVTAYPNIVYALDLTKPGAPLKWSFAPKPAPASQGVACCDVVNRGGTVDGGKYIFNTLDGQTIAVDVKTGRPIWRTQLGNINKGESITMAPTVAQGRVYVGDSGGEMGVHGWLVALDENTGKLLWRAYSTGPDTDVLIGPDFKPHYRKRSRQGSRREFLAAAGLEDRRRRGLGLGHLRCRAQYVVRRHRKSRTVEPGAASRRQQMDRGNLRPRPGDAARPGGSTNIRRTMNMTTTASTSRSCSTCPSPGRCRRCSCTSIATATSTSSTGQTGAVLSADPFGPVNSTKGVDLQTGRLIMNPDKETKVGQTVRNICPTASGAKDWNPSSFSPADRASVHPAREHVHGLA